MRTVSSAILPNPSGSSFTALTNAELAAALKRQAGELGFDLVGIAAAARPEGFDWLRRWLERGFAGEMEYIPRREAAYEHPRGVLPPVRSVIMLAMNYRTQEPSAQQGNRGPDRAVVNQLFHVYLGRNATVDELVQFGGFLAKGVGLQTVATPMIFPSLTTGAATKSTSDARSAGSMRVARAPYLPLSV